MLVEAKRINKEEVTVTTSLDVAETFGKEHKNVVRDIKNLECSEEFRRLNFERISYMDSMNRKQKAYNMTKDGFTLLAMGYTGQKAMRFKEGYIKQFNAMGKALLLKEKDRIKGIGTRNAFTDALQDSNEPERMHGHAYSTYTNLIYKTLFGKNAKELREQFKIGKDEELRDRFSSEELKLIHEMELLASGLIALGWGYDQIKTFIEQNNVKRLAA